MVDDPRPRTGLSSVEYLLILALLVILAIAAWPMVQDAIGRLGDLS